MKSIAQLLADISSKFPDNTGRLITPELLREVTEDIVNSYYNTTDNSELSNLIAEEAGILAAALLAPNVDFLNLFAEKQFYNEDEAGGTTTVEVPPVSRGFIEETLPAGDYELTWYAEMQNSSTSGSSVFSIELDSTEVGYSEIEPSDSDNWNTVSGLKQFNVGVEAVVRAEVFHSQISTGTSEMRRIRISIKPVNA